MAKEVVKVKILISIVNIFFLSIGILDLIYGAEKSSRYYYYDNIFIRTSGALYIISSIGLWLKKDLARRTIIFLNMINILEVIITTNFSDMNRLEGIIFLSGMMLIIIGPTMPLLMPSTKLYLKNVDIDNIDSNEEEPNCEPITKPSKLGSASVVLFLFSLILFISSLVMAFRGGNTINNSTSTKAGGINKTEVAILVVLLLIFIKGKFSVFSGLKDWFRWLIVTRFEKRRSYDKIINRYTNMAEKVNKKYLRDNLLGLAALYKHDSESAIGYFKNGLKSATGVNIDIMNDNLVIAYLQGKKYQQASALLEYQRGEGNIAILSYIIMLLFSNRDEEAKQFYTDNPLTKEEKVYADTLVSFSLSEPETLNKVKELLNRGELWIYHPILENLIERWELQIFFNRMDRYDELVSQGKYLLYELEKEPQILNSPEIRYMRSLIYSIIPKVSNYFDCSSIWGIIENLDELSLKLPILEELQNHCALFWKRIYYIFYQTSTDNLYNPEKERLFINQQLPRDSESIISVSSRCKLYYSNGLKHAIRSIEINQNDFVYHYVDIIPQSKVESIVEDITPIINILLKDSSIKDELEPLLYWLTYDPDVLTLSIITNVLTSIPSCYQEELEYLKNKFS